MFLSPPAVLGKYSVHLNIGTIICPSFFFFSWMWIQLPCAAHHFRLLHYLDEVLENVLHTLHHTHTHTHTHTHAPQRHVMKSRM